MWGGIAITAILALKLLVLLAEPHLTFMPVSTLPVDPGRFGLAFEAVAIPTEDGETLHAWFIPARPGARRDLQITLAHFHGNAENIASYAAIGELTERAGYNLLLVDYRGYGRSSGSPSEQGIYRDGEAALRYLRSRDDVDPAGIVLWGRSIGACVAVHLAARGEPLAGLILESSFTSARELLWSGGALLLYPLSFLASYRLDQREKITRVAAPLLVVHGTGDRIAPFELGRRLYDLAPGPKRLVSIEGGGHNDLLAIHGERLWDEVRGFLDSLPR